MASSPELLVTHRVVVGISDMAVASSANVVLSTYALGSCVGVLAFDSHTKAAGLIHSMLPTVGNRRNSDYNPCMFVDTGLPALFKEMSAMRALKARMGIALIGGASVNRAGGAKSFFKIGEDNVAAVREYCQKNALRIVYEDVGGFSNRTIHFYIGKGQLTVKKPTGTDEIELS
ncbi:MAG: chemotaxis protein CheD [Oceanipulchritudo sp.]